MEIFSSCNCNKFLTLYVENVQVPIDSTFHLISDLYSLCTLFIAGAEWGSWHDLQPLSTDQKNAIHVDHLIFINIHNLRLANTIKYSVLGNILLLKFNYYLEKINSPIFGFCLIKLELIQSMYQPIVFVLKHCFNQLPQIQRLFKQLKFIKVLELRSPKWAKSKGCDPLQALWRTASLPFLTSRVSLDSLTCAPFHHLQSIFKCFSDSLSSAFLLDL